MTNSEAWYNLKMGEVEILERCDENLLRKIFETPCTTPKCMLYLESGCKPIRFLIMTRRLLFLHYILNEDAQSLISQFFEAQNSQPLKDDWSAQVFQDLQVLEIHLTLKQIKNSSREQFKKLIDQLIHKAAFKYLLENQKKSSKVLHIRYEELKMQTYLQSKLVNQYSAKFIFNLRSRMLDVAKNYPNKTKSKICPVCKDPNSEDTQEHILNCPSLFTNELIQESNTPRYQDLFENDVKKQLLVSKIIETKFKTRKKILRNSSQPEEPSEPLGCSTV